MNKKLLIGILSVIIITVAFIISQALALTSITYQVVSLTPIELGLLQSTWRAEIELNNPGMPGALYVNRINSEFYAGETRVGEAVLEDYYVYSGLNTINLDFELDHTSGAYALLTGDTNITLKTRIDAVIFGLVPYTVTIEPNFTNLTQ